MMDSSPSSPLPPPPETMASISCINNLISEEATNDRQQLSEERSRRMILDSYEKAGVDLPIISLEMVLDRETSAANQLVHKRKSQKLAARFGGAAAMCTSAVGPATDGKGEPSPVFDNTNQLSANAATDTNYRDNNDMTEIDLQISDVPMDEAAAFIEEKKDETGDIPLITSAGKNKQIIPECGDEVPFVGNSLPLEFSKDEQSSLDACSYCCPEKSPEEKYVISNLQLPEGFEDEAEIENYHEKNDVRRKLFSDIAEGQKSLVDVEGSVLTTSNYSDSSEMLEDIERKKAHYGYCSIFRGTRQFRLFMLFCCILHVVLISLIVVVAVNNRNNEEAGLTSSSTNPGADTTDESRNPQQSTNEPTLQENVENVDSDVETSAAIQVTEAPCIDTLQLSSNCFVEGSDILVFFRSCVPEIGDWVAIYDSSEDATNLMEDDSLDWLFTCGSQHCTGAIFSEVLPFSSESIAVGSTYVAHLMRDGDGPSFSSLASSSQFRVAENIQDCRS